MAVYCYSPLFKVKGLIVQRQTDVFDVVEAQLVEGKAV
jgi:hypothetical protein